MDDRKIIDLFFERSEQAIIELSNKYGSVCSKVAFNILNNKQDTEECVNDAYLGTWNTIPPQNPNPLLSYVCRIVRNLAIKKYHTNTATKRNSVYDVALDELENCFPSSVSVEDEFNATETARIIDNFLATLDQENRIMFVRRYWHSDSIDDLANLFQTSNHNISVRLSRTRENTEETSYQGGSISMKRKNISETIDNINPQYIDEATEYTGAEEITHRNAWYKRVLPMAAAFACVCLVVAVSAFVLPQIQDNFIGPDVLQGDDPTGNSSDITNTPPDKTNSLFVNEVSNLSSADMDVQFTHYNALNATEKDNMLKQFEAKVGLSYTEFTGMISKTFTEKQFYSVNVPTDKSRNEYTPHDYVIEYQTANEGQITLSICPTEKPLRDCIIICDNPTPSIINDASAIIYGIQNSYMVQFSHKNMYYDIETRDVTLEELELFLNSILSR